MSIPPLSPMENVDIVSLVISFIGPKHYRFIAVISKSFHAAYQKEFPSDTRTSLNACTIEHAAISWEGLQNLPYEDDQSKLCNSASFFGSLPALKYLRSVGCHWNKRRACQVAAGYGQLHILQYAQEMVVHGIKRHVRMPQKMAT